MSDFKILPSYNLNLLVKEFRKKTYPRCGENVQFPGMRGRNNSRGNKCGNIAKLEIDGRKMCIRHAERYALIKLLQKENPT